MAQRNRLPIFALLFVGLSALLVLLFRDPAGAYAASAVLWSAGHEGGNLGEWTASGGGRTYSVGSGTETASTDVAHSGGRSARLSISNASGSDQGAQLLRWAETAGRSDAYYSTWMYFPKRYSGMSWWNVMQWQSVLSSGTAPQWILNVGNRADGSMYFYLWDAVNKKGHGQSAASIPVGRWFHVEAYYKFASDGTGRLTIWQDGNQLLDVSGVRTRRAGDTVQWAVGNYTDRISPTNPTIYVDDAAISTTRLGPSYSGTTQPAAPTPSPAAAVTSTPVATSAAVATSTPVVTSTAAPTSTPVATSTPVPSVTPVATNTPPAAPITFAPSSIPLSDGEIGGNPGRGAYRWYSNSPEPSGWPAADGYVRWTWRQIEPTEGNYNWSLIDNQLAAAASRGGTFGLRIMPANSWDGGTAIPDYLMSRMPLGFWFNSPDNGRSMYAPDWNDSDYMARSEALIRAIASRYANDPRFGWIEMGPYGDYGEWHVWRWPYPASTGATDMTLGNRQRLIDLHAQLFPANKLLHMIDSATGTNTTMAYALSKSPEIGIRSDCFGTSLFDTRMGQVAAAGYGDRWKTAPIMIEYCNAKTGSGQLALGKTQVANGHVSLLEGNHASYSTYTSGEQQDFNTTRKLAGYRYRPVSLSLPQYLSAGSSFTVNAQWANDGVAPTYRSWNVVLQLRNPVSKDIVWQGTSKLNLRSLLPTASSPLSVADTFTLGSGVASGSYDLEAVVKAPEGYFGPLALAIQGRAADGSYKLGSVNVR